MTQATLDFRVEDLAVLPPGDWRPPALEDLPDRLYGVVGFDLETEDRGLAAKGGAGWAWRDGGRVVGYAVAADNWRGYLPIGHPEGNLDPDRIRRWLNRVLADEAQPKVGASVMYDLGWAKRDGVEVRGPVYDVQLAEALLDEHRVERGAGYSLEALAREHLGRGKDETLLREAAEAYGVDPKAGLWRLPARYVGPYGEADAVLARDLWAQQVPRLRAEDLWDLCQLEHDLLPMYVDMRWRGVRVDVDRAERLRAEWVRRSAELVEEIRRRTGVAVNIWAAASLAPAFDAEGLAYGRTLKTDAPSITKEFLGAVDHWLPRAVLEARQLDKLVTTFVDGHLLGGLHAGRVHAEIHPLASDEGGTVTGRLSYSNPNLQQLPARSAVGRQVRECLLPEEGERWCSPDFASQEPRLLVHFASRVRVDGRPLPGALEMRDRYRADPSLDLHGVASEILGVPRKQGKVLNLAIIYGRGVPRTADELGLSTEETRELFERHAEAIPFARRLARLCQRQVERRGYVRSLLGRRVRFPLWEPASYERRDGRALPRAAAEAAWPGQRLAPARLHKALNSLIQPSAADQMKLAMLAVWRAGLGRRVLVQVHDELGCSVPDEATGHRIAELMRDAAPLDLPSQVDVSFGSNWGEAK